jgi:hypothetical protein
MLKIGFGSRVKPKMFGYKPRYYDADKEELLERVKKYQATDDESMDVDKLKNRIRSGLRMKFSGESTERTNYEKQSNIRLIIIITALALASYVIMSSNKIIALIEGFSK